MRVSQLRKALGPDGKLLATQPPGYVMRMGPPQLDLLRFEQLVAEGERAFEAGDSQRALERLDEGLGLWRGPPLADLQCEPFAQAPVVRLEELRLPAVELRVEAGLALCRHARLAGELQALVGEHPLHERLWGQLMLALYRDGRQAEALAAFSAAGRVWSTRSGIEPGPPLQDLHRRSLAQDPHLGRDDAPRARPIRTILALPGSEAAIEPLVNVARPLAVEGGHEIVVVSLLSDAAGLAHVTNCLNAAHRTAAESGARVRVRVAAFTSRDRGGGNRVGARARRRDGLIEAAG